MKPICRIAGGQGPVRGGGASAEGTFEHTSLTGRWPTYNCSVGESRLAFGWILLQSLVSTAERSSAGFPTLTSLAFAVLGNGSPVTDVVSSEGPFDLAGFCRRELIFLLPRFSNARLMTNQRRSFRTGTGSLSSDGRALCCLSPPARNRPGRCVGRWMLMREGVGG